jgi:DNA-binding transcriptional MerR regulator
VPYKEKEIEKLYYSIGEVAEMFNVSKSLIRFWETEFDILKPRKSQKGNRLFTKKDIENLRVIYYLVKEKGYTLEGARMKLKGRRS